jgi:hypothetical protein
MRVCFLPLQKLVFRTRLTAFVFRSPDMFCDKAMISCLSARSSPFAPRYGGHPTPV